MNFGFKLPIWIYRITLILSGWCLLGGMYLAYVAYLEGRYRDSAAGVSLCLAATVLAAMVVMIRYWVRRMGDAHQKIARLESEVQEVVDYLLAKPDAVGRIEEGGRLPNPNLLPQEAAVLTESGALHVVVSAGNHQDAAQVQVEFRRQFAQAMRSRHWLMALEIGELICKTFPQSSMHRDFVQIYPRIIRKIEQEIMERRRNMEILLDSGSGDDIQSGSVPLVGEDELCECASFRQAS